MSSAGVGAGSAVTGEREVLLAAGRAALTRLALAHETAVETVLAEVQERTGERLLVRRPGVLDAGWDDLRRMSWQASNFEAAVKLLQPLMKNDGRTLGAVLKTAEPVVVQAVARHLVEAGVLPLSEEVPQ